MNEKEARLIAQSFLETQIQPRAHPELVLTSATRYEFCWVFGYNSLRFVASGEFRDAVAGNGPIFVNQRTGIARLGVSRLPVEDQLDTA